jgi:hypothetical protein
MGLVPLRLDLPCKSSCIFTDFFTANLIVAGSKLCKII